MLNRNSTSSSLGFRLGAGLWWAGETEVSAPVSERTVLGSIRMRINVPMVPHKAWSAVKVYGKGKWMRTDLLYNVRVKLRVKYKASHSGGESGRERIRRRKKVGNNRS